MVRKPGWEISASWEEQEQEPDPDAELLSCHITRRRNSLDCSDLWLNSESTTQEILYISIYELTVQGTFCSFTLFSSILFPFV